MFLTAHVMIAFILYEILGLNANIWLFLFCSILPDASWPFYKNHRKNSWYHTPFTFIWIIFFYPYWIAVISHFIADFFSGGIRLVPWSKKGVGIKFKEEVREPVKGFFIIRIYKHLMNNYKKRGYFVLAELILLIITLFLIIK